jgi:hypothetical protein
MLGCSDASAGDKDEEDGDDGEWIGAVVGQCRTGLWRYGWASVATCGIVTARVAARGIVAARVAARGQAACYDSSAYLHFLLYFDASRTSRPALADPLSLSGLNAPTPIPLRKACALTQVNAPQHSIRQVAFPHLLSHHSCAFSKTPPDPEILCLRLTTYLARHTIYSAVYVVHCLVYMTLSDSCR